MTKQKPPAKKTRPSIRVRGGKMTDPPVSEERKKRAEADTLPPPPPTVPPRASGRGSSSQRSTERPPRHSIRVKKGSPSAEVDEVTADLSKDPRREK